MLRSHRFPTLSTATMIVASICAIDGSTVATAAPLGSNVAPGLARNATSATPEMSTTPLALTVWLNLRDRPGLDRSVATLYRPSSTSFHHWLNKASLSPFVPGVTDIDHVRDELTAYGITTTAVLPFNLGLRVSGSTAQIEAAFHTVIGRVAVGTAIKHIAMTPPRLVSAANVFRGLGGIDSVDPDPMLMFRNGLRAPQTTSRPIAATAKRTACFSASTTVTATGLSEADFTTPVTATISGLVYGNISGTGFGVNCGYSPTDVRSIYGLGKAYEAGLDGTGQTIVIIDFFLNPQAEVDGNVFSGQFGLPQFDASDFTSYAPDGGTQTAEQVNSEFATETDLDIEWAHAVAPGAKIALVQSLSSDNQDLQSALLFAVSKHLGNVISLSFGVPEQLTSPTDLGTFDSIAELASAQGISIQVSSGDNGDDTPLGIPTDVNGVGSSPFDTVVGGTSVAFVPPSNSILTAGWGNNQGQLFTGAIVIDPPASSNSFVGGSGGGASRFFAKPAYQAKLPGVMRLSPDVAALADPFTGADFVFDNAGVTALATVGGTSLATPIFSAIWAIVDQAAGTSVGQAAPLVAIAPGQIIRDVLPVAGPENVSEAITGPGRSTSYTPYQLSIPLFTTTTFASALSNEANLGETPFYVLTTFGTDTSLQTAKGWDNVTGFGTPNVGAAVTLVSKILGR